MDENEFGGLLAVLFLITVCVVSLCCLGGCYICQTTDRMYIEKGYVYRWNSATSHSEWVKP